MKLTLVSDRFISEEYSVEHVGLFSKDYELGNSGQFSPNTAQKAL